MASDNIVRIGIVGYGKIGAKHRAVFETLGAEVVASCNRSEAGRASANQSGIKNTYASPKEMIEKESIDALVCATSLFNNYEVAKTLIPFQIPILLEKPPGTSMVELENLVELQKKYGTLIMLATNRIWYSVLHNAIEDIGGLDKIEGVQVMWSENPERLKIKRGFKTEQINNRNFSNSIHGFSILQYLCGDLIDFQVFAQKGKRDFDWNMSLQGVSKNGIIGQFTSSWSSILPWRLSFYGGNKIYDFAPLEQCICTNLSNKEQKEIKGEAFDKEYKPGFYLQAKHFLKAINTKRVHKEASLQNALYLFKYADALTNIIHKESFAK